MMEKVESVLTLTREIVAIEDQERELAGRKEKLRQQLAGLVNGGPPLNGSPSPSLPQRIVGYLAEHATKAFKARQLADALGIEEPNVVAGALSRLAREERVHRVGRGRYRHGGS